MSTGIAGGCLFNNTSPPASESDAGGFSLWQDVFDCHNSPTEFAPAGAKKRVHFLLRHAPFCLDKEQ